MKKYYFLLFLALFTIANAQTDLARWALTSNGNVSYSDSRVTVSAIGTEQNIINYDSQGMRTTAWGNTSIEHYRYFGFSVSSSSNASIKISNLAFEQERLTSSLNDSYTIKYYIAPNSSSIGTYDFFNNSNTVTLVNNETITGNAIKNIPLNITISGSQRLIIRFYGSGNDYNNATWRIKANTLKLTEVQATVPIANNDSYNVYKNTATDLNILSNDTSGSAFTGITITQQPAHGTLTVNGTSNVKYTPTAGYSGADSFKYRAGNVTGPSNEATVSLNVVTAVPVANNDSYNVYNFRDSVFNILNNDTSTLAFTGITITQQPLHGTVTVNGTSNVTYKSVAGYVGSDSFKYQVSNVTGESNEATVSINVTQDPNTAVPVANNDSYTAYKNNEAIFNVLSNDTSVLTINGVTITQQPTHGTLTVNGTTNVSYKPTTGYTGSDTFKYKASNSTGSSNEATVSINVVENVNTALARWNNSNFASTFTNTNIDKINLTSTQALSYVQDLGNGYNAFHSSGWPDKNAQTVDTSKYVQFTISPKQGYKLNLAEFNFECRTQGGDANIRVDYSLSSNFSNPRTILPETAISSGVSAFSLTNFSRPIATDGQVLYLRIYVYNTWDAFQILLKNGQNVGPAFIGYTESSSTAPLAYDDTVSNIVNNDIDIDVLVNDDYSNKINSLTFTQPAHGSTTLNANNSINYIPAKDYIGTDSFNYYITNEFGVSNSATVNITNNPNVTSPLIRWDKVNFTATTFQTFINSTEMKTVGNLSMNVGGETNPRTFYIVSNNTAQTLDPTRYVQFVMDNTSSQKTIEPKTFKYRAKGTAGTSYEIRISKTIDFSSDVVVLAKGTNPDNYTEQSFAFEEGLKLEPGEKLYIRLYLLITPPATPNTNVGNYVQYVIQFLPGAMGPEIDGLYYNRVYSPNNTIWLNPANPHWSNGVPNATKSAIVDTHYDTAVRGSFESKDLTINPTGSLTINEDAAVTVNGQINNKAGSASFVVADNGNLLQKVTAENSGNITVKKTALLPKMGYNYWSSPVKGQNLYQFSDGYNQANGGTGTGTPWNQFLVYNETNDRFVTSLANEITLNAASNFEPSRGYAIRGKNEFPDKIVSESPGGPGTTPSPFKFVGVPQNGDISSYNLKWSGATRGYNMVGNPYPSNINFDDLFEANSTKIYGVAYFWTNNDNTVLAQQGSNYNNYKTNNYALLNGVGGTSATYAGSNNRKPNGHISVAQGFIVQAKQAGKNTPLVFNNSMRHTDGANYYNKAAKKDRFWLEFKSPTNVNNEILIGYLPLATNGFDADFDTELLSVGNDSFWSILDTRKLGIQAKKAPVFDEDIVKIGMKAAVAGNYTITLTDKDGAFEESQIVYLKDKYQNKVINISSGNYVFYSNSGEFEDRFEIIYKPLETLGTDNVLKSGIQIYQDVQNFIVKSSDNLDEVSIYDAVGRLVYDSKVSKREISINKNNFAEGLYIIKARSGNTIITKKVLK
ncbi:hypothetical protein D3C87_457590 [compost metagenome]